VDPPANYFDGARVSGASSVGGGSSSRDGETFRFKFGR
jgi:hypothetical protein